MHNEKLTAEQGESPDYSGAQTMHELLALVSDEDREYIINYCRSGRELLDEGPLKESAVRLRNEFFDEIKRSEFGFVFEEEGVTADVISGKSGWVEGFVPGEDDVELKDRVLVVFCPKNQRHHEISVWELKKGTLSDKD